MCVSSFSRLRDTYVYNSIIFPFSGASLGAGSCAPPFYAYEFLELKKSRDDYNFYKKVPLMHNWILLRCVVSEKFYAVI